MKNHLAFLERQHHDIINKIKSCLPKAILEEESDLLFNTFNGDYQVHFTIQIRKEKQE